MLILSKALAQEIIQHGKEEFPNEACGILAGKEAKAEKIYRMTNIDKSPELYFMDSREQLKVMKEIRNLGLELVGIYHSHVASYAYPSSRDVELAFYPEASYLITSLRDQLNPEIRSFRIKAGRISEEELRLE